jgi:hypothetical protein
MTYADRTKRTKPVIKSALFIDRPAFPDPLLFRPREEIFRYNIAVVALPSSGATEENESGKGPVAKSGGAQIRAPTDILKPLQ